MDWLTLRYPLRKEAVLYLVVESTPYISNLLGFERSAMDSINPFFFEVLNRTVLDVIEDNGTLATPIPGQTFLIHPRNMNKD